MVISEKQNGLCSISQLSVLDAYQDELRNALNVALEHKESRNAHLAS
jgi:hypothetical protein